MGKYTFIITEKPDAARRIASALDFKGKAEEMKETGLSYYMAKREREILVVPALGHLYTVAARKTGRDCYPVFDFEWVPRHVTERGAKRTRKWLQAITRLARDADVFIDACDYDIEGSIVGYCILKYACDNKDHTSKRMKYSTLTKEELERSYAKALPHLDFALIEAGLTRHEVDWLYGINLSRALTIAARNWSGKYATLSTGRVQGPVLKFLVAREKSIRSFVPTPYWQIRAQIEIGSQVFEAEYEKKIIETRREADTIMSECKGKNGQVEKIDVRKSDYMSPLPFDLGSMQAEAYKLFGYTPKQTSNVAQRLYLDALISYPRTSSQKLPPAINYDAILKNLGRIQEFKELMAELVARPELKPNEGNREDPAHPAIYATGNLPERVLNCPERNIWGLVIRRFMAVFGEPAVRQIMKIYIGVNGHGFHFAGARTLVEGWTRFYKPYVRFEEVVSPPLKEGQTVNVNKVFLEDRFTKPPPRYDPSSLLRRMEKAEIGTKATRADMIQTLYSRKYIRDERMKVTDLGFEVAEILQSHCPKVTSVKMTRELEARMDKIYANKEKGEDVLADAIGLLKPVLKEFREKENVIGEQLSNAIRQVAMEERAIGSCPICGAGKLIVLYSRKTGKRFVGCTSYFEGDCKTSFPLPQKGSVRPLARNCRRCGWPTVQVRTRSRSWTLCFNPRCPSKEGWRRGIEMRNM